MSSSKKAKTRRHVGYRKFERKNLLGVVVETKWLFSNKSLSVFKSPPKPRLLKDPKIGRAILIS